MTMDSPLASRFKDLSHHRRKGSLGGQLISSDGQEGYAGVVLVVLLLVVCQSEVVPKPSWLATWDLWAQTTPLLGCWGLSFPFKCSVCAC